MSALYIVLFSTPRHRFTMVMSYLPNETTDAIIDYLYADPAALRSCALTCKSWLPSSRLHLFTELNIVSTKLSTLLSAAQTPSSLYTIMPYVRHLTVVSSEELSVLFQLVPYLCNVETLHLMRGDLSEARGWTEWAACSLKQLKHLKLTSYSVAICDLLDLVRAAPALQSISMDGVKCNWDEADEQQRMTLRSLRIPFLGLQNESQSLISWLLSQNVELSVQELRFGAETPSVFPQVQQLLAMSPSMQQMEISFSRQNNLFLNVEQVRAMRGLLSQTIDLSACTDLRTLKFSSLWVPYDMRTHTISRIISRIACESLEGVSLSLRLTDLSHLHASFVFDFWVKLFQVLSRPQFSHLKQLRISLCEGSVERYAGLAVLYTLLRPLDKTGILRFQ